VLAVLTVLLGSGTAISLTAGTPTPGASPEPSYAALGSAPETQAPSPSPSPPPAPEPEPAPAPEPQPEPPATSEEQVDEITALEDEVTVLTNDEREEAGCDAVATDERLRDSARGHSEDMAVNDYFDHTGQDGRSPFDRMADAGYPDPAAENIAYGYRTPADVMDGWMNSEGHRDNILNCDLAAIGVGLAYDGDGRPYWTQNFGR
jgi:uncharacterized protein YkwD